MQASTSAHRAADGASIHVYRWTPDEGLPRRGVIHIAHGMAEHGARYARLAEALTAAGYVVYANDHRGHGKTARAGELGHLGPAGAWTLVLDDLRGLIRAEKAANPGLPFVLLGHSMGSFLAQELLFDLSPELDAAILSGSNGKPTPIASAGRLLARVERARLGERGTSKLLTGLSFDAFNKAFAPNRTKFDWLSRDASEVDAYAKDPLCGFECTTSTWVEVLDALARIATPGLQSKIRRDLPIFIVTGAEDPANDRGAGVKQLLGAYARAGVVDVTSRFYEGARHELFNETNRDEVTADVIGWLDKRLPVAQV
jgi:alpha-beta hydrolase superfamily lysophospholipase